VDPTIWPVTMPLSETDAIAELALLHRTPVGRPVASTARATSVARSSTPRATDAGVIEISLPSETREGSLGSRAHAGAPSVTAARVAAKDSARIIVMRRPSSGAPCSGASIRREQLSGAQPTAARAPAVTLDRSSGRDTCARASTFSIHHDSTWALDLFFANESLHLGDVSD